MLNKSCEHQFYQTRNSFYYLYKESKIIKLKILKIFLLLFISLINTKGYTQKFLSDVTITYDISAKSEKDNSELKSFSGTKFSVTIKGLQSRTDMVSKLGIESAIYDPSNKSACILKEYSNQKLMILLSSEDWTKKNLYFNNLKFKSTNEQKAINGYNCNKATAISGDGDNIELYYSPDFTLSNTNYINAFQDIKGLPVLFSLKSGDIIFSYSLKAINFDYVPNTKFELPKSGYRIMNYSEAVKISN